MDYPLKNRVYLTFCFFLFLTFSMGAEERPKKSDRPEDYIRPYAKNPRYWQVRGEPVLLLGGAKDDSLFQIPDLKEHLDLLAKVGGNYVRNTMSSRLDHGFEIHAFKKIGSGKYDLNQWNDAYWERFENLLRWGRERGIIVQIEVWDRFDYTDAGDATNWLLSPYNPKNNVNYTSEQSGLATRYPAQPWLDRQPFFHTIPGMPRYKKSLDVVRQYQERFVGKMLSHSLRYPNVLYCMNNETSTPVRWGQHWMNFIRKQASAKGLEVFTTDMFDDVWSPQKSAKLKQALEKETVYPFLDISQVNSRSFNEGHWKNLTWIMEQASRYKPRPLNNVKIYGDGNTKWGSGSPKDGVERFWRDLIGGCASVRHHRDGGGIGLQPKAQSCIRAARKVESLVKFWDVEPRMGLLSDRGEDEAYLAADPGKRYVLYFTDGGEVGLDLSGKSGRFHIHWVGVGTGEWGPKDELRGGGVAKIKAPGKGGWVAVVARQ